LLDAGLAPALEQLVERHRLSGLTIELQIDPLPDLPSTLASALYGVAVEALRNVVRHADATQCSVALDRTGTELLLSIVDNGAGIAPDAVSGVGLQSMRERADAIGATLRVEPARPHGTRVELAADLDAIRVLA
jgi:signal transduction histidine kinase